MPGFYRFVLAILIRRFAQILADLCSQTAHQICGNLCESADSKLRRNIRLGLMLLSEFRDHCPEFFQACSGIDGVVAGLPHSDLACLVDNNPQRQLRTG